MVIFYCRSHPSLILFWGGEGRRIYFFAKFSGRIKKYWVLGNWEGRREERRGPFGIWHPPIMGYCNKKKTKFQHPLELIRNGLAWSFSNCFLVSWNFRSVSSNRRSASSFSRWNEFASLWLVCICKKKNFFSIFSLPPRPPAGQGFLFFFVWERKCLPRKNFSFYGFFKIPCSFQKKKPSV